jgi:predicted CoA-binding protein/RimJ/RimL family protein N-acetyltransferase
VNESLVSLDRLDGASAWLSSWNADVLLSDGSTATVRPATAADRSALVRFHQGLSARSTTLRYFGAHPELTERDLDRITAGTLDHFALVGERGGRIVAVAEYHRPAGSTEAEVAFVVDDAFQGLGLGTVLLEHLATAARQIGIHRLVAYTLSENTRMLAVFRTVGFARSTTMDSGMVRVVLDIDPSPASAASIDARDHHAVVQSMNRLLRPRSIAVVGASRRPATVGHELVRNLVDGQFAGPVYPVNPHATSVASLPCWPSVSAIPGAVDLAVISVPAREVAGVVAECGGKGVGGLVVISAGFAETGEKNAQDEVVTLAHQWGMRVIGPNCFGVLNTDPEIQLNATFARDPGPRPGRLCIPVRWSRYRDPGRGQGPGSRSVDFRVDGQQGRRERERPPRLVGGRPSDRCHPLVPRVLRQPVEVLAFGAPRWSNQADCRGEGRSERCRPGCRVVAHGRHGQLRRRRRRVVRSVRGRPGRQRRRALRRRRASRRPAGADRHTGWDREQRRWPGHLGCRCLSPLRALGARAES